MTSLEEQFFNLTQKLNANALVSVEDLKKILTQVNTLRGSFFMVEYYDFVGFIHAAYQIDTRRLAPGLDFWRHLVDNEFELVSNGGVRQMNKEFGEALFDEDDKPMQKPMNEEIFQVMRHIFFKELAQLPEFKEATKINFYIVW